MQAGVYGMRGSYSMDPSEDPESKLAESLAKSVEQGAAIAGAAGSIAIAPFLATAGDIAGQTLVRSGAGAALDSATTGSRAVTSTLQQGLSTIRGAAGQTLTQRAGTAVGIEMVGTRGVVQAAAADTLGTTAATATSSTGGRVPRGLSCQRWPLHARVPTRSWRSTLSETRAPRMSMTTSLVAQCVDPSFHLRSPGRCRKSRPAPLQPRSRAGAGDSSLAHVNPTPPSSRSTTCGRR